MRLHGRADDDTAINRTETDAPEQTGQAAENETDGQNTAETFPILGLIIDDDGSDSARLTMYGFLRTAETLCYASKVFRAKAGDEAAAAVDEAKAEGITALMIFSPDSKERCAIEKAVSLGMDVVAPYYECKVAGIKSNVVVEQRSIMTNLRAALQAEWKSAALNPAEYWYTEGIRRKPTKHFAHR